MTGEALKNPGVEYRIVPFWFWNGEMSEPEMERQIREMADKGLGGFFICARQGLRVPYLSDEWFRKVGFAVREAEKRGLQVWLYDEYPYPSGIAGGEVLLEHPEAGHRLLRHVVNPVRGREVVSLDIPWGKVLYAKAVRKDPANGRMLWSDAVDIASCIGNLQEKDVYQSVGLTAYNQKRYFTYGPGLKLLWTAPEGDWEIVVFVEEELQDFKYYGTFVDPCHAEAMSTFIRLTHDRHARAVGDRFRKSVMGIFTDEIGLLGKIPWSPEIRKAYSRRYGRDLADDLPLLLYRDEDRSPAVRYRYFQTIHEVLREAYHKQVHDWCEKHGIRYAAEAPSVRMTTQAFSHIPGTDSAHEKLGRSLEWILQRYAMSLRYNPRMASSLARQLGRERVLVECFHSVGWSMTLQGAKWMIDRLAAMGINMFVFHVFFYTIDRLTKHWTSVNSLDGQNRENYAALSYICSY